MTDAEARPDVLGPLAAVWREQLMRVCAPLFWGAAVDDFRAAHAGTCTLARTENRFIGITAWHVLHQYLVDSTSSAQVLRIFELEIDDMQERIIDFDDGMDLATFRLNEAEIAAIGKPITPANWPPRAPQQGSNLLLAGFPRITLREGHRRGDFGLMTVIGVAHAVTDDQISWLASADVPFQWNDPGGPSAELDLGGISGGPMLAWFESAAGIVTSALCGIVVQAPLLGDSTSFLPPLIIGKRADLINSDGTLKRFVDYSAQQGASARRP